jgi:hypothetical protein
MNIYNLIYEITRRCNATCEHCMRGDAQNKDIDNMTINASLMGVDYISTVVFTGGEPSLAVDRIRYFTQAVKERHISVDSFYVVTNGKVPSLDLALALMELYAYCESNEATSFCISKDQYHEWDIGDVEEADKLYKALAFYAPDARIQEIKNVIDEGRAHDRSLGEEKAGTEISILWNDDDTIDAIDSTVYVNALGDVCTGCDLSYESQEKLKIGSVHQNTIEEIFLRNNPKEKE